MVTTYAAWVRGVVAWVIHFICHFLAFLFRFGCTDLCSHVNSRANISAASGSTMNDKIAQIITAAHRQHKPMIQPSTLGSQGHHHAQNDTAQTMPRCHPPSRQDST